MTRNDKGMGKVAISFYYEFSDHDYYALVKVTNEAPYGYYHGSAVDASKIYAEHLGIENYEEVVFSPSPNLRTEEYAFEKFVRAIIDEDGNIGHSIKEFDKMESGILLIDKSLI